MEVQLRLMNEKVKLGERQISELKQERLERQDEERSLKEK
jgi:hypothetical protein